MDEMPNDQILLTYRLAALFKFVGVLTAIATGAITIWEFAPPFYRWWSAGLGAIVLLILLAPWWQWLTLKQPSKLAHRLLIFSLAWGLITPNLELLHAVYQPYQDLYAYPQFVEILKFTPDQVNNIHGFGQMFIIVPVIVATWQYRFKGMIWSLLLAGVGFVGVAFLMPFSALSLVFFRFNSILMIITYKGLKLRITIIFHNQQKHPIEELPVKCFLPQNFDITV